MNENQKLGHQAAVCPFCGGDLDYHKYHEFDCDTVNFEWDCFECMARGVESWDMVFTHHYDLIEDRGA